MDVMNEITVGQVSVIPGEEEITFVDCHNADRKVTVAASDLYDLMSFVAGLNPNTPDRRSAFRFSLWRSSGLSINVSVDGEGWAVRPLDLSEVGALVELPAGAPDVWPGSEMDVSLQCGTEVVKLHGIVRRRNGNQYGIQFPGTLGENSSETPESLSNIICLIERGYLSQKVSLQ